MTKYGVRVTIEDEWRLIVEADTKDAAEKKGATFVKEGLSPRPRGRMRGRMVRAIYFVGSAYRTVEDDYEAEEDELDLTR